MIEIDESRQEVKRDGRRIHLAPQEYRILLALFKTKITLSRERIAQEFYSPVTISSRTIDQHVCRLRRKVGKDIIETVSKYGYKFA